MIPSLESHPGWSTGNRTPRRTLVSESEAPTGGEAGGSDSSMSVADWHLIIVKNCVNRCIYLRVCNEGLQSRLPTWCKTAMRSFRTVQNVGTESTFR